jgi:hypothetical protein
MTQRTLRWVFTAFGSLWIFAVLVALASTV